MTDLTLVQNSSIANTMVRCSEMLVGLESAEEKTDTKTTVENVFAAIHENFWLIPKVTLNSDDDPVLREEPTESIPEILSEIWNAFTSEAE